MNFLKDGDFDELISLLNENELILALMEEKASVDICAYKKVAQKALDNLNFFTKVYDIVRNAHRKQNEDENRENNKSCSGQEDFVKC